MKAEVAQALTRAVATVILDSGFVFFFSGFLFSFVRENHPNLFSVMCRSSWSQWRLCGHNTAVETAVTADDWRSGGGDYDGMKTSQCHPAAMVTVTDRVPCRPAHSAAVDATVTLIK